MVIHEMSRPECLAALAGARLARLACSHDDQPYVVPIYYVYHQAADREPYLYGFTTPGQKVQWMRANPRVCVEWDAVTSHDQWSSVVAFGRYEELPDPTGGMPATRLPMRATPAEDEEENGRERRRAEQLLQEYRTWWQAGYAAFVARKEREGPEHFEPVYYRIHLEGITGYRATPSSTRSS